LYYATCMKRLHAHPHKLTRVSQLALCICGFYCFESSVHYDKTQLWFIFTFISLFSVPAPSLSTHNSSMPPLYPHHPTNICHLAEARHYGCNNTYQYGQVTTAIRFRNRMILLLFLRNINGGGAYHCYCTFQNITSLFLFFVCLCGICTGTRKHEKCLWEKIA
jgi:hypothetical protein